MEPYPRPADAEVTWAETQSPVEVPVAAAGRQQSCSAPRAESRSPTRAFSFSPGRSWPARALRHTAARPPPHSPSASPIPPGSSRLLLLAEPRAMDPRPCPGPFGSALNQKNVGEAEPPPNFSTLVARPAVSF